MAVAPQDPLNMSLERDIREVGIEPLNFKEVKRYQARRVRQVTPWWILVLERWRESSFYLFWLSWVTGSLGLILTLTFWLLGTVAVWVEVVTGISWIVFGMLVIAEFVHRYVLHVISAQWVSMPLGESIPDTAKEIVRAVEENCPSVYLYMEVLRRNHLLLDRYLVVRREGDKCYLYRWNEPKKYRRK